MIFRVLQSVFLLVWITFTAADESIILSPPRLVVEYGASATANCSTNINNFGMGWEAPEGGVDMTSGVKMITWNVDKLTEWNIKPYCFVNFDKTVPKGKHLEVTLYKIPDNVSISLKDHTGSLLEGNEYTLQCQIQNVAPVKNLIVKWYKGPNEVKSISFNGSTPKPENTKADFSFIFAGNDDGAHYRCEALLELGPEGPQPPPRVSSKDLIVNVSYSPKFSSSVETYNQTHTKIILNCTVRANPSPTYIWNPPVLGLNTSILELPPKSVGNYTCTAANAFGSAKKLFIIQPESSYTTFWAIVGICLILAVVFLSLIIFWIVKKIKSRRTGSNFVI